MYAPRLVEVGGVEPPSWTFRLVRFSEDRPHGGF